MDILSELNFTMMMMMMMMINAGICGQVAC